MKNLFSLLMLASLVMFTSCNKDEAISMENNDSVLKSVTVDKNTDGTFSVTHKVSEGVATEYDYNHEYKVIQLFTDSEYGRVLNSKNYNTVNHKLKLHFISDTEGDLTKFEILDSDLPKDLELLDNYSFSYNNIEKILTLNFSVKKGVVVSYSNENGMNKIYLNMGNGTQTQFTKKYNAAHGDDMNFNFVQNISRGTEREKPILMILDGEE